MIDPNTKRLFIGKAKYVFQLVDYLARKENRFHLNGIGRVIYKSEISKPVLN